MGTCAWVECRRPTAPRAYFCAEHHQRIATAQSSSRPTLDAEPTGGEQ